VGSWKSLLFLSALSVLLNDASVCFAYRFRSARMKSVLGTVLALFAE